MAFFKHLYMPPLLHSLAGSYLEYLLVWSYTWPLNVTCANQLVSTVARNEDSKTPDLFLMYLEIFCLFTMTDCKDNSFKLVCFASMIKKIHEASFVAA